MTVGRPRSGMNARTRPVTIPHPISAVPTEISGHGIINQDVNNFYALPI